jgi:hypothetical protein
MNKLKQKSHVFDTLFVSLLFFVFLFCALTVVVIGSLVYRSSTESMNEHFASTTALSYLVQKVRQNDKAGSIEVTTINGVDALKIHHTMEEDSFETYIYAYNGQLLELFIREGVEFSLGAGSKIMPIQSFKIHRDNQLFTFTITDDYGNSNTVSIVERSVPYEK